MDDQTILITGACGFIGCNLTAYLKDQQPSWRILTLDKRERRHNGKVDFLCSITTSRDISRIFEQHKIDIVIHMAALTSVDKSFENPTQCMQNNVMATQELLNVLTRHPYVKLLHISTDEVLGPCTELNHREDLYNPTNPYAASKAACELAIRAHVNAYGLKCVIVRSNNVYGPHQSTKYNLIPRSIRLLFEGSKVSLHGDGTQSRRYVHVSDYVNAIYVILQKAQFDGQIYNIGTDSEHSNLDVARRLVQIIKPGDRVEKHIEYVPDRQFNDTSYYLDLSRLIKLGWCPNIEFNKGLQETVDWYKLNQDEKEQ